MNAYKGYYIKRHREFPSSVVIATEGRGGKIPNIMQGIFTSYGMAKAVIDDYVKHKEAQRKDKNASKGTDTGGV